jgi:hypothetical protein
MIWRLFMFKKLLPLLLLFAGFQANAALIDNGYFSTDNESGLDWLDWTLTTNKMQHQALAQYSGAGWRVATGAEAHALMFNHFGLVVNGVGEASGNASASFDADRARFNQLFGTTWNRGDSRATIVGYGVVGVSNYYMHAGYNPGGIYGAYNQRGFGIGVALVKVAAVSEPAIIALFGLGLVGIGFARRKRQS